MGLLQFSDGESIETSGELRRLELNDGLYVVGQGFLIPVGNEKEVKTVIASLNKTKK